ncbi:MAG TPA: MaoC/PaaZ C-terminal domain-containing protein [Burkholderiales bacterium]|nr:MaoC/PaaZ C-terminal domain-containing protein [Burkholderiales bacterium]
MRISAANIVGREVADKQRLEPRWLMAFSAALGETDARYYDTAAGVSMHPLFPVCYEWPATRALRERAGLAQLDPRLVHAQHDLTIHRMPTTEVLRITGKVVAATQRRPGALVVFRFVAHDGRDQPVTTTDFSVIYRGVKLDGGERSIEKVDDPPRHKNALPKVGEIEIAATAAHTYTECARIWNPIHTDVAYARAAGLPGTILHGTATLALSVSRVLSAFRIDPRSLRRVRCRFAGMLPMPSVLTVLASTDGTSLAFEARNAQGETILERGWITG